MNRHELARRMAVTANALITISLFLVMLWWRASLVLFVGCWLIYAAAWWIEGSVYQSEDNSREGATRMPLSSPR